MSYSPASNDAVDLSGSGGYTPQRCTMTKTEQDIPQEDEVYVAGDTASVLITVRSDGERLDATEVP